MRAAPSVQAVLTSGAIERRFVLVLHLVASLTLAAWLRALLPPGSHEGVLASTAVVSVLLGLGWWQASRLWPAGPAGVLIWSGQAWQWRRPGQDSPEPPLRAMVVALDWGRWMLLRSVAHDGRHRWWGVSVGQAGTAWHGLRVALHAHAGEQVIGARAADEASHG